MTTRPSTAASILAVLAVFAIAFGLYAWGYFALGRVTQDNLGDRVRVYKHGWQVTFYGPAAQVEAWVVGDDVWLRDST